MRERVVSDVRHRVAGDQLVGEGIPVITGKESLEGSVRSLSHVLTESGLRNRIGERSTKFHGFQRALIDACVAVSPRVPQVQLYSRNSIATRPLALNR